MTDSSFLPAGTILENNYQIIQGLGQGGFARTYLAANLRRFQENCVLKEFAPQTLDSQVGKATEMFEREASIMYKLDHPQIPKFREQFKARTMAGESLFIVQDYIEGDNYWQLLRHRGQLFSEVEIARFFQQILPVLEYIHRMGVIHRDISPDNIICRRSDALPVLIDFGAVKEAAAKYSHVTGTVVGKIGFAPDEQMRRGQVSPASDLHALAVTALVLLTGREPHQLYNIRTASWEWERSVNVQPGLAKVINKMLAYRSKDRYQSAAEVLAALLTVKQLSKKSAALPGAAPTKNFMSRLQTLIVSPKAATTENIPPPDTTAVDWKKTIGAVTKVISALFCTVLVGTAGLKFLQHPDLLTTLGSSISRTLPQSFDPLTSMGELLPKSFDPMKSFNAAIPKSFDPIKSVNQAIANWLPPHPAQPLPNIPATQIQAQRKAVQKQLQASGLAADQFYKQVDRVFYEKHLELHNRQLQQGSADSQLRAEWWSIAQKMLSDRQQ